MDKEHIIQALGQILSPSQVNTDSKDLYDASADRYKKYAKARQALDVPVPAAIVYPKTAEEVSRVLSFCNQHGVNVIPRAGKTATEGGLENWKDNTVVIDTLHLDKILKIDTYNMQATAQAGVPLQMLEDAAREKGLTTGHSPSPNLWQSWAGWCLPGASGSSPPCTGESKTWWWDWSACFPTAILPGSRTWPGGPAVRISGILPSATRARSAISRK